VNRLALNDNSFGIDSISPMREMGAYEALWATQGTPERLADQFRSDPTALTSDFVEPSIADEHALRVMKMLKGRGVHRFGVRINHAGDYPQKLRDAALLHNSVCQGFTS
jgi:DNA processing protein